MLVSLAVSWTLQNVPATPRLAPITNPITHLVAAPFPVLLVVPAFAVDLVCRAARQGHDWRLAAVLGPVFVLALAAASWPAAAFLLSPLARNPVFLADQWDFSVRIGSWTHEFWDALRAGPSRPSGAAAIGWTLVYASLLGAAASRFGLWWGDWMRRVRR
jgi:hypothetical protein